jgi:hypothetical protein
MEDESAAADTKAPLNAAHIPPAATLVLLDQIARPELKISLVPDDF